MSNNSKRKAEDNGGGVDDGGPYEPPPLRSRVERTLSEAAGDEGQLLARAAGTKCKRCLAFRNLDRLEEFLTKLPKTDLHVHLDGSPRISTLIELAQKHGVELPAYTEEGLREKVFKENYESLNDYLTGFPLILKVMQQKGAAERIAYEFAQDCIEEGVLYVEPRFAPQLLATADTDIVAVLKVVCAGLDRARDEHNATPAVASGERPPFAYGVIVCAMRKFLGEFSPYYKELTSLHRYEPPSRHCQLASVALVHAAIAARDEHGLPVVGIDIAGQEAGFPAAEHSSTFELAHKNWLGKTVHAGEAWGPESVFQAISDLHAQRLGHGYNVFSTELVMAKSDPQRFVDGLVRYCAVNRVLFEVCLTSNQQTMPELRDELGKHRLKDMLAHGLCVSICTDNRLVSNTTVVKELMLAIEHFALTPSELKTIILEGVKRSFFGGANGSASYLEKRAYVKRFLHCYEEVEREFGLHDYYLSNASFIDDTARSVPPGKQQAQQPQYCARHQDEHTDPLALSPSWRESHAPRHAEVPPEVFM